MFRPGTDFQRVLLHRDRRHERASTEAGDGLRRLRRRCWSSRRRPVGRHRHASPASTAATSRTPASTTSPSSPRDELAVVEDAGDTLHSQRNALDSGYIFDVAADYSSAARSRSAFLAEGRDASATIDAAPARPPATTTATTRSPASTSPTATRRRRLLGAKVPTLFRTAGGSSGPSSTATTSPTRCRPPRRFARQIGQSPAVIADGGASLFGMATTERRTAAIDRARLKELTERERAHPERTRARRRRSSAPSRSCPGRAELVPGRRPVARLPRARQGLARLGRRRQRVRRLPQRLRRHVRRPREPGDRRRRASAGGAGTHFAAPTEGSIVVAEELRRRWGLPQWRFTNSGTESTMDAIHLARGATGRDVIVKIEGTYHGHHDAVMVSVKPPPEQMGDARRARVACRTASATREAITDADQARPVQRRRGARARAREPRARSPA